MSYEEMDRHLAEGTAYSARTIPDGVFDRWIRSAQGEFFLVSGRWEEAEKILFNLDADAAEAYLGTEILSLRGLLLANRGRYDEAAAITEGSVETALRIGDLQAVMPTMATIARIRIGLEDDAGAIAAFRRAIERRGDIVERSLSAWVTFEGADVLTTLFVRDPGSPMLAEGLELVSSFARRIVDDILAGGDLTNVEVQGALFGAAIEQLASLAGRAGVSVALPVVPGGRAEALGVLDREHRLFDAARIRLWLAEDGDPSQLAAAAATFEELGAHPYIARSSAH
jgi:tetratricopeptide (TPR) repeat protein